MFAIEGFNEFDEIASSIVPSKVETPYLKLFNDLRQLVESFIEIGYYDKSINNTISSMQNMNNDSINQSDVKIKILEVLNSKSYLEPQDWDVLSSLIKQGRQATEQMTKRNELENDMMSTNSRISIHQKNIPNIISNLTASLNDIASLDIAGEKRINHLQIKEAHLNQIDAMPNVNNNIKKALKELLTSYVSLEIACFKLLEDLAKEAIINYNNRSLVINDFETCLYARYTWMESEDFLATLFSKFAWLEYALEGMTDSLYYNVSLLLRSNTLNENAIQFEIKTMEQLEKLISTGTFDQGFMKELVSNAPLYTKERTLSIACKMAAMQLNESNVRK